MKNVLRLTLLIALALCSLVIAEIADAAQVTLTWNNPSTNTDGSALTNLSDIIITYAPCSSDHTYLDAARGTPAEKVVMTSVAGAAMSQVIDFPAKGDTCFVAVAQNTIGQMSAQSAVAVWYSPLSMPGKPVQLSLNLTFQHHKVKT